MVSEVGPSPSPIWHWDWTHLLPDVPKLGGEPGKGLGGDPVCPAVSEGEVALDLLLPEGEPEVGVLGGDEPVEVAWCLCLCSGLDACMFVPWLVVWKGGTGGAGDGTFSWPDVQEASFPVSEPGALGHHEVPVLTHAKLEFFVSVLWGVDRGSANGGDGSKQGIHSQAPCWVGHGQ